ncbi:hypothetical protein CBR_g51090 [Chara braunii]|uniref:Uncharacterized protein n=1 Tax=Chara braunii TaxID=69332 RepID=A0A388K619_CHABU|nr:hypothetical protein CBR_g51090 [Chara braunii]|eukprot:GBG65495.1 hypothetical protein CBR_g51090 [Chara braunii]
MMPRPSCIFSTPRWLLAGPPRVFALDGLQTPSPVAEEDSKGSDPDLTPDTWWDNTLSKYEWLRDLPSPSKPTKALISTLNKHILEEVGRLVGAGKFPHLTRVTKFNEWAELAWTFKNDRAVLVELIERYAANAEKVASKDLKEDRTIELKTSEAEKVWLKAWGLPSTHLDWFMARYNTEEADGGSSMLDVFNLDEDERMEVDFLIAPGADLTERHKRPTARDYERHTFLPLVSSHWIEDIACSVQDRVWRLESFNHLAPIGIKAYKFLAGAKKEDLEECYNDALAGVLVYGGKKKTPHKGGRLSFPALQELDAEKCQYQKSVVMQKTAPLSCARDLNELKKFWNMGRPYLKCKWGYQNTRKCDAGLLWFDQVLWYLFGESSPTWRSSFLRQIQGRPGLSRCYSTAVVRGGL